MDLPLWIEIAGLIIGVAAGLAIAGWAFNARGKWK